MSQEDLEEKGHGHDKGQLLQINRLIRGAGEVKGSDDLTDNQDGWDGDKEPLQAQKQIFSEGGLVIKTIFKFHDRSFPKKMIDHNIR